MYLFFALVRTVFFSFSSYNMVDGKTLKINIVTIMKSPEMLRFVLHYLKAKSICKNSVKKLSFVIEYVSDQYNTKEICDEVNIKNSGMLGFIPDCHKYQKM